MAHQSMFKKIINQWKFICVFIGVSIPVFLFVYNEFSWKASINAQQVIHDTSITEIKADRIRSGDQFQATMVSIDRKFTSIQNDVSEIKGEIKILTHYLDATSSPSVVLKPQP